LSVRSRLVVVVGLVLVLVACGGGSSATTQQLSGSTTTPTGAGPTTTPGGSGSDTTNPGGGPSGDSGATLTIGNETWVLDSFRCVIGEENTGSKDFPFTSHGQTDLSDTYLILEAEIQDWEEVGKFEGDDVYLELKFVERPIDNARATDLSVHWISSDLPEYLQGDSGLGDLEWSFDGTTNLVAEGTFRNMLLDDDADPAELFAHGKLEAVCEPW